MKALIPFFFLTMVSNTAFAVETLTEYRDRRFKELEELISKVVKLEGSLNCKEVKLIEFKGSLHYFTCDGEKYILREVDEKFIILKP